MRRMDRDVLGMIGLATDAAAKQADRTGWDVLSVTGVATALATSISLLVNLWWRRIDRREADWITHGARAEWKIHDAHGNNSPPHVSAHLDNVGDGPAFRVRVIGVGCHAYLATPYNPSSGRRKHELLSAVQPGAGTDLLAYCDPREWSRAFVVLTWVASPTRRRIRSRRSRAVPLSSISDPPVLVENEFDEVTLLVTSSGKEVPPDWRMPNGYQPQRPMPTSRAGVWWAERRERRNASR